MQKVSIAKCAVAALGFCLVSPHGAAALQAAPGKAITQTEAGGADVIRVFRGGGYAGAGDTLADIWAVRTSAAHASAAHALAAWGAALAGPGIMAAVAFTGADYAAGLTGAAAWGAASAGPGITGADYAAGLTGTAAGAGAAGASTADITAAVAGVQTMAMAMAGIGRCSA